MGLASTRLARVSGGVHDCGACTVCCTHLPIPAGYVGSGEKPAGVTCPLLISSGCSQYAQRPKLCADFRCAWLSDPTWTEAWRPDQSSVLVLRERLPGEKVAAAAYEIAENGLQKSAGLEILRQLEQTTAWLITIDLLGKRTRIDGRLARGDGRGVQIDTAHEIALPFAGIPESPFHLPNIQPAA